MARARSSHQSCSLVRSTSTVRARPGPPPSLAQSFVLCLVLRGLAAWHLHVIGVPCFPLPSVLPTRVGPVTNLFACCGANAEGVVQIVSALAYAQGRVVLVFHGPQFFVLSHDLINMQWFTISDMHVIISRFVTHTVPLGQHNVQLTWG